VKGALGLLFVLLAACPAQERVSGKITFPGLGERQADLLGRNAKGWVSLRRTNETAVIEFPATSIDHITFDLEFDDKDLEDWQRKRWFKKIAARIQPRIMACLSYADISNNFLDYVPLLLRSLLLSEQFEELDKVAGQIMHYAPPGIFHEEARLSRAFALLELGQIDTARRLFKEAKAVKRGQAHASIYWFVQARLQMLNQEFDAAHDTFSNIVVHNAIDLEWLPRALYWSVAMYVENDERQVAEQIISELDKTVPERDWAKRARKLLSNVDCIDSADQGYDGFYHWMPRMGLPGVAPGSGHSVGFDGMIQYVDIGPELNFIGAPGSDFTLSLWVLPAREGVALSRGDPDSEEPGDEGFVIRRDGIRVRGREPVAAAVLTAASKSKTWRHVAFVRSSNPPRLQLFEEGKLTSQVKYSAHYNFGNPEAHVLFACKATPMNGHVRSQHFLGALDDLQVYDTALSPEQVQALYEKPGQPGQFATRRVEIDFHNDGGEFTASRPIRGLKGPLALDMLNEIYASNTVSAFNLEFGAAALEVIGEGDPGHRLKLDADERLGERLFWVNRSGSTLPFSRVGVRRLELGETSGFVTLMAFAETIYDARMIKDLDVVGKQTVELNGTNLGLVDLDLKPGEPAMAFCIYRSDAAGEPLVDRNAPPAILSSVYVEYARKPIAHFMFNELPRVDPPPQAEPPPAETPPDAQPQEEQTNE
jgi:tetratricopeptide (TPR) repeat protein